MLDDWRPPRLLSERLVLRPVEETDAEAVFAYCSDPDMTHFTLWDAHQGMGDTLAFVRDYAQSRYREQVPEPMNSPGWSVSSREM